MPTFNYDETKHEYSLLHESGRVEVLPSVTQIIDHFGLISEFSKNEEAALRGSYAHKAAEYFLEDRLDWSGLDPALAPYIASLAQWQLHTGFTVEACEVRLYHPALKFAGTYDAKGFLPNHSRLLIDFKTGSAERWHEWQTAGYLILEGDYRRRGSLYLQKDGSMARFKEHDDESDIVNFISMLNVYRLQESMK